MFSVILPLLFIDSNGRSCLGPPQLLFFIFLGLPSITLLYSFDILILLVVRSFNWEKLVINLGFILSGFILLFLLSL
ncbi:hypothetical protein B0A66_17350 [Flavobacterium hercynium]|uniref:Uncharacterized protein n=1 Tax=Flavobacterium hercynium TaxID=387094 RepID=A0A226GXK4_9FLAO|nr:hypothetical protein B0A66_17350 [Flavobacterium hercynium]